MWELRVDIYKITSTMTEKMYVFDYFILIVIIKTQRTSFGFILPSNGYVFLTHFNYNLYL